MYKCFVIIHIISPLFAIGGMVLCGTAFTEEQAWRVHLHLLSLLTRRNGKKNAYLFNIGNLGDRSFNGNVTHMLGCL